MSLAVLLAQKLLMAKNGRNQQLRDRMVKDPIRDLFFEMVIPTSSNGSSYPSVCLLTCDVSDYLSTRRDNQNYPLATSLHENNPYTNIRAQQNHQWSFSYEIIIL